MVAALLLPLALSACTAPPRNSVSEPASSAPQYSYSGFGSRNPFTVARYFFSASGVGGVLEVSTAPPSICYETQSAPIRPIKIQVHSEGMIGRVEESYAPQGNRFCDRSVRSALAADMILDPSGYRVVWSPHPGGPVAFSPFTVQA